MGEFVSETMGRPGGMDGCGQVSLGLWILGSK